MHRTVTSRDIHGAEYEVAVSELNWRPAAYGILVRDSNIHVQSLLLYFLCELGEGEVSRDGQEPEEKEHGLTPEWVPLKDLDGIKVGSTVDWRPIVKRALGL